MSGPAAKNADDALKQLSKTLDDVEDAFSGVAKSANPGLKYDGRMYPPFADNIIRNADGTIDAVTKGNIIKIAADGTIRIFERLANGGIGKLILEKLGGG